VSKEVPNILYMHIKPSVTFTPQQKEGHLPLEGERQQKSKKRALDLATALRRWLYGRVVFETYGRLGEEGIERQDHFFLLNHS
jgi:hypothetical protein